MCDWAADRIDRMDSREYQEWIDRLLDSPIGTFAEDDEGDLDIQALFDGDASGACGFDWD